LGQHAKKKTSAGCSGRKAGGTKAIGSRSKGPHPLKAQFRDHFQKEEKRSMVGKNKVGNRINRVFDRQASRSPDWRVRSNQGSVASSVWGREQKGRFRSSGKWCHGKEGIHSERKKKGEAGVVAVYETGHTSGVTNKKIIIFLC